MIGKLNPEKHQKWPVHLGSVLIAYNATQSLVMGYSLYYLMFGHRPRLPIDLLFPTHREHNLTRTIDEYVKMLYRRLWKSVKMAQDSALKGPYGRNVCMTIRLGPWSCDPETVYW